MRILTCEDHLNRRIGIEFHLSKELLLDIFCLKTEPVDNNLHKVWRRECLDLVHYGIGTAEPHHIGCGHSEVSHSRILRTFVD